MHTHTKSSSFKIIKHYMHLCSQLLVACEHINLQQWTSPTCFQHQSICYFPHRHAGGPLNCRWDVFCHVSTLSWVHACMHETFNTWGDPSGRGWHPSPKHQKDLNDFGNSVIACTVSIHASVQDVPPEPKHTLFCYIYIAQNTTMVLAKETEMSDPVILRWLRND